MTPAIHHDITRRYQAMLRSHHIFTPICRPDPGTDLCHILWMLGELMKPMETGKAMRWLGFIQGVLIERGLTTVTAERDFTRPYFVGYSDADALRDLQESILQSTSLADFMAVKKMVEAIREAENDRA